MPNSDNEVDIVQNLNIVSDEYNGLLPEMPQQHGQIAQRMVLSTIKAEAFNVDKPHDWADWLDMLEFQFEANGVTDDNLKRATFFSVNGQSMYRLVKSLVQPASTRDIPFSVISQRLTAHFRPQINPCTAYSAFISSRQKNNQSVVQYVAELRDHAEKCKFGSMLDTLIRYQFVCGLRDEVLKMRLMPRNELSLQAIVDLAATSESTSRDIRDMALPASPKITSTDTLEIHRIADPKYGGRAHTTSTSSLITTQQSSGSSNHNLHCFRCGLEHMASACPFDSTSLLCSQCQKQGHLVTVCHQGQRQGTSTASTDSRRQGKRYSSRSKNQAVHQVVVRQQPTSEQQTTPTFGQQSDPVTAPETFRNSQNLHPYQLVHPQSAVYQGTGAHLYKIEMVEVSSTCNSTIPASLQQTAFHINHSVAVGSQTELANNMDLFSTYKLPPPIKITINIDGMPVIMEVDCGAAVSVMSQQSHDALWPSAPQLRHSSLILKRYGDPTNIQVSGWRTVRVSTATHQADLPLVILRSATDIPLIGRNWFEALNISIAGIHSLRPGDLEAIWNHPAFGTPGTLGTYKGPPVHLPRDPNIPPKFLKCRQIPFALRERVEDEIRRLQEIGVLRPIRSSRWASPIVVVPKRDGSVRLCGDYSATVNPALFNETYPLPTSKEMFAKLERCVVYSKLDMQQAFLQLPVDQESADILTINTPLGLFSVHRMQFGVKTATAIFQREIEETLVHTTPEGLVVPIPGVAVLLDDILVGGPTEQIHDERLSKVLNALAKRGLSLNKNKCQFRTSSVQFLGFQLDASGIHPLQSKITAICEAPAPTNKSELKALLGLINFYDSFISNKSTIFEPLYRLLDANSPFIWSQEHEDALKQVKIILSDPELVLTHYNSSLPIILACDASAYGLGAVISHPTPEGAERPIAYASRTMSKAERNYGQIDKEACSIIFGVRKFHQFLAGRTNVIIVTDHKPLVDIFNPKKSIPDTLSPRMLRWRLILAGYDYEIQYRKGKSHANADALSRLPLPEDPAYEEPEPVGIHLLELSQSAPVSSQEIASFTATDPILSKVLTMIHNGWPSKVSKELQPYAAQSSELSLLNGCILRGDRVVLPHQLRNRVLHSIHAHHHGIVRTKAVARQYIWYPGLSTDITAIVRGCTICDAAQSKPVRTEFSPWPAAKRPWERVHIDYCGPIEGQVFLVAVDAYSRWPEVWPVSSMNTDTLIRKMRLAFAAHGVPQLIVSDNGAQLVSEKFNNFLSQNGARHITTAPYMPCSNGLAERMVAIFKAQYAKQRGDCEDRVARAVFAIRTAPCTTTGKTPAALFLGRQIRTPLDCMRPSSVPNSPSISINREFSIGDRVMFLDYRIHESKWSPGIIVLRRGAVMYEIQDEEGTRHSRRIDQIRARAPTINPPQETEVATDLVPPLHSSWDVEIPVPDYGGNEAAPDRQQEVHTPVLQAPIDQQEVHTQQSEEPRINNTSNRRPIRNRMLPHRYRNDFIIN